MMANNAHLGDRSGAARRGLALLAGLLRCRRCGRKLMVSYTDNGPFVLPYACHRSWLDNGEGPCISFAGLLQFARYQALDQRHSFHNGDAFVKIQELAFPQMQRAAVGGLGRATDS